MNYSYSPTEYVQLLKEYYNLENISFTKSDNKEYVLKKLEERSSKKRIIYSKANTIISEYIERFEKDFSLFTKDDALKLEEFYNSLIDPKTQRELDVGISLRIAKIQKEYYKATNDIHNYIRKLYDCVTDEKLLLYNHSDIYVKSHYINEVKSLFDKLDELNDQDRKTFYNIVYWVYLNHNSEDPDAIQPAEELLEIDKYLQENVGDKDLVLKETIESLGVTRNSINCILEHFLWSNRNGKKVDVDRFRPQLERFSSALQTKVDNMSNTQTSLLLSCKSVILHAKYQLGHITMEELLDGITELQGEHVEGESPVIQATRLAKFNYHYLTFLYRFSGYDSKKIIEMSQKRIKEALPKILKITKMYDNFSFNQYLLFFILGASYTSMFDEFSNMILDMTVYSDKALFVHTEMVKELSIVIFDYLIEVSPEIFNGVCGYEVDYIVSHKEEMRNLLKECCMFHDVGKFFMIDIVSNSLRKLTDEEFSVIKTHPANFEEFSRNWINQDERLHCIHDCALTHHLWHDGTRGYPNISHTKNRPFVDILSVADSIDAATDFYGRPYRETKTIDSLIEEFKQSSGTRYGKDVVNSLSNKNVKDKIQELITNGRKDIYYKVYTINKI